MTWWIECFTTITMTSNNDMCYPTVKSISKVRKKFNKYIEHLFFPVKISYKYIRFYRKTFSLFCWMQLKDSYKKVFQTQYAADQIPFVCFSRATIRSQRDNFIISTQMVAQEKYTNFIDSPAHYNIFHQHNFNFVLQLWIWKYFEVKNTVYILCNVWYPNYVGVLDEIYKITVSI